jgi:hypothetical protein
MPGKIPILTLALALAACASSAPPPPPATGPVPLTPSPPAPGAQPVPLTARPGPSPAGWAVSIIGTPFALAFKTAVCAASVVIAAPIAGLLVLDPDPYSEGHEILGAGLANNCGPPYVISPYSAS